MPRGKPDSEYKPQETETKPIGFEDALRVIEGERPEILRRGDTPEKARQRTEFYYQFTVVRLSEEGETLPVLRDLAATPGVGPIVKKTLTEWRLYFVAATGYRAGIK